MTAPAPAPPPGGAAHPGQQVGHLEDVVRDRRAGTKPPARHVATAPPSLRDGRTEATLRTLELTVRGRLDGLLQGNHLGLVPGPGSEPGEARAYQPGDDVRRMDWAVTARTTLPHVRQTVADRELETWVVLDLSASLDVGTAACEKRDHAVAAAACWLVSAALFLAWMLAGAVDDQLLRAEAGYAGAAAVLCALLTLVYHRPPGREAVRG